MYVGLVCRVQYVHILQHTRVCLMFMPYVYALCVCLMCMPYVYGLYTRLGCMACYMSYMHAANAGAARAVLFRVRVCVYVYM